MITKNIVLYQIFILTLLLPVVAICQNKKCYVWVNNHWEGKKANKVYNPDSVYCIENGQALPRRSLNGSISISDHRTTPGILRTISFQPKDIIKLFPKHTVGDREFAGNGPNVTASVSIKISENQQNILAHIKCKFVETVSDWTTAEIDFMVSIYEVPMGKKIMKINSNDISKAIYTDISTAIDRPVIFGGNLVNKLLINGDTGRDDVGNGTDDDSYMSIFFYPVSINITNIEVPSLPFNFNGYQIKCKETSMLLDVKNGLADDNNSIWQYKSNLTSSQRFTLIPNNGSFLIKSNISDLYLTVKKPPLVIGSSASVLTTSNTSYVFTQNKLNNGTVTSTSNELSLKNQLWKLIPTVEEDVYFIESVAFSDLVIQSPNSQSGEKLMLVSKSSIDIQKWIIQKPKINNVEANYGYGPFFVDAPGWSSTMATIFAGLVKGGSINGASVESDNIDVNILAPAHRSVGEMVVYEKPIKSYQRLEGIVLEEECQVAISDFPTCHYTHDFTCRIKPNSKYEYLLATSIADPDFQENIEMEWETGLGQENAPNNPAILANKVGNSFGFFSEGHQRNQLIWNWPTAGDSIYVEGMWIWERGHGKPHTEIHPPHFIAIKRHLPISFNKIGGTAKINNNIDDQYYGQKVDVFASADGSAMWNSKNLKPFSQMVDMKRQDYTFTITAMFSKPTANAQLKWLIIKQSGNELINPVGLNPIINLLGNGKSVSVKYLWKSNNVSNKAKIAQTLVLFWDVPESKGILNNQKPILFSVTLEKIIIKDNHETLNDHAGGDGDCIIYANVADKWLMLNEFGTTASDPLSSGIGYALDDDNIKLLAPPIKVYLLQGQKFRIFTKGWENDHMNGQMGNILDEYSRKRSGVRPFIGNIFSLAGMADGQIEDDEITEAVQYLYSNSTTQSNITVRSKSGDYELIYSIKKID